MPFRKYETIFIKTLQYSRQIDKKQDFNFLQVIGTGGFGKVWKVSHKATKQLYALKVMTKAKVISKKSVKAIMKQRTIQTMLCEDPSDSIINLKAAFQDTTRLYLLMYFIQGKDLRYYLNNHLSLTENQIKYLVYGILKALQYLHRKKIIHRDLKPQNIIIDQHGLPHLTDFGLAELYKKQNSSLNGGTMGYMAPELLLGQNHTNSVDYYALGVITYELFYGKRPFQGSNSEQLIQQMVRTESKLLHKQNTQISDEAKDFIDRLLQKKQKNRLGFSNISQIFQHPWIVGGPVLQSDWKQPQFEQHLQHDSVSDASSDDQDHTIISNILQRPHIQQLFKSFDFPGQKCQIPRQPLVCEKIQTQFSLKSFLKT